MQSEIRLSTTVQEILCCPICKTKLEMHGEHYQCNNTKCRGLFPIINGIPILIDEDFSLFSIDDFVNHCSTTFDLSPKNKLKQALQNLLPDVSRNIKCTTNYEKFTKILLAQLRPLKVLVIGGSM